MLIKVDSTAKEVKSSEKGFYRGVKNGNRWLNVWSKSENALKAIKWKGTIDVTKPEAYETEKGTFYSCWLQIEPSKSPQADKPVTNTIKFWSYIETLKLAHDVASDLEPDTNQGRARSAIVNTIMMAVSKSEVTLPQIDESPKKEEEVPAPDDDDMPEWANE